MPTINIPVHPNTPATLTLAFYAKHPTDTQVFQINATAYLADAGRSIVGNPTITCPSSDIVITSTSRTQGIFSFTVSGGVDSLTYGLTFSATLDNGTTLTRVIWLPVLSNSFNTTTPTIIAKGDRGQQGIQGITGSTGQAGTAASVPAVIAALAGSDISTATVSPDGGATHIPLSAVALQSGAALPSAGLPASVVTVPTTSGRAVDNPATQSTAITIAQADRQIIGDALPAAILENNASLGTTGIFWTQADATARGGVVNHQTLMIAAVAWSGANGRAVIFGPWQINLTAPIPVAVPHVHLIFHEQTRIVISGFANSSKSLFVVTADHFRIDRGIFGPPDANAIWTHWQTGLVLNAPTATDTWSATAGVLAAGTPIRPSFSDFFTVYSGALPAGAVLYGTWLTSATQLFQNNSNTLYFDGLPVGLTLTQLNALLAAGALPVHSNRYLAYGSTIAQGTVVALSTIGGWTGYAVPVTPPAGVSAAVINTSVGALPAITASPETYSAPANAGRPDLASPSILLLSAAPVFCPGGIISNTGNGTVLNNVEIRNVAAGRAILTSGNRFTAHNCKGWATDGNVGSAIIRMSGGANNLWLGGTIFSGDQAIQFVPGSTWQNNGFIPASNISLVSSKYIGVRAASLSAQTVSFGLTIQNQYQYTIWTVPSLSVGNVLTIPGPLPSGLTLAALQASGPNASNPIYLTINGYVVAGSVVSGVVVNGNGSYTLTLTPPAGVVNAIKKASSVASDAHLTAGVPLGAMTCSIIGCAVHACELITLGGIAINGQNGDSTGTMDINVSDCVVDSTWATNAGAAAVYAVKVIFGVYGGGRLVLRGNHFVESINGQMSITGNGMDAIIDGNTFGNIQAPTGKTAFSMFGFHGGGFTGRNVVWCPPGADAMTIGGADFADDLGQTTSGQVNNFDVVGVVFRAAQDGFYCVRLGAGFTRRVMRCSAFQASPLGAGSAGFVRQNNVTGICGPDYVSFNDLSMLDGRDYVETGPTLIYGGDDDVNNPAPAVSGAVRTTRLNPKRVMAVLDLIGGNAVQRITTLYSSGTPPGTGGTATVNSSTAGQMVVLLSQGGTCISATLTIPPGGTPEQQLQITTVGGITAFSLSCTATVAWTNGTAFPAGTSINFVWDATVGQWDRA